MHASVLWLALMSSALTAPQSAGVALPPLSALTAECTLSRDWIASQVPLGRSYAIWLRCGNVRFVVVHPDNLIGKVHVRDSNQALEFARFFTAQPTFGLMHFGGCVEVVENGDDNFFHVLKSPIFRRHLRPPEVEPQGGQNPDSFVISRTVLCPDQRIYRWREQVDKDGLYFQLSKTVVVRNARTLGLVHWPPPH